MSVALDFNLTRIKTRVLVCLKPTIRIGHCLVLIILRGFAWLVRVVTFKIQPVLSLIRDKC